MNHKDDSNFSKLPKQTSQLGLKKVASLNINSNLFECSRLIPKTTIIDVEYSLSTEFNKPPANRKSKIVGINRVSGPTEFSGLLKVFKTCGPCEEMQGTRHLPTLPLELFNCEDIYHYVTYLGGFKESLARFFFRQLLKAVEKCYYQGLEHKDLKLQDLFLDEDFRIMLSDFGIKKEQMKQRVFKSPVTKEELFWHASYSAPEVLRNEKSIDQQAADVFSLGVCLFVMCCAHTPFREATKADPLYIQLIEKDPQKFWKFYEFKMCKEEKFSEELRDLVTRMIAYDPQKRIKLEEIKIHPWYQGLCKPSYEVIHSLENVRQQLHIKDVIDNLEKKDSKDVSHLKTIENVLQEPIEEDSLSERTQNH